MSIQKTPILAIMIKNDIPDDYKNITKISIINKKRVFYPLRYVLQERDIVIDENDCLTIFPLPEDIKFPSSNKGTDAGTIIDYKVEITVNNQSKLTRKEIFKYFNQKVIVVLHYSTGKIIIGCNELPLLFLCSEENTTNPAGTNGYSIECRGNAYFPKVIR